jgi:galactokinase
MVREALVGYDGLRTMKGPDLVPLALRAFSARFSGAATTAARAPARVELLGNHTDYNGGLVLAVAIDRFTVVAGRRAAGHSARFWSAGFGQEDQFALDAIERSTDVSWGPYVRGVCWALQEKYGELTGGVEASIVGDVPLGAGLSSSASLQAAVALFLWGTGAVPGDARLLDGDDAGMTLARTLQRSENAFVGVASGLLDQFSVLFGRAGHALVLDCLDLSYERLPLGSPAIVVCDSKTSRRLADGMYNTRRAECERVVAHFQAKRGSRSVRWLRDISLDELLEAWDDLDPVGRLRARHVLTENLRVGKGVDALRRGDLAAFGRLMSESHASSRDDFANSSPALDALIQSADSAPGFLGGKLSGAGWAGCTVNLVVAEQAEPFAGAVAEGYAKRTGVVPEIHVCHAAAGACLHPADRPLVT